MQMLTRAGQLGTPGTVYSGTGTRARIGSSILHSKHRVDRSTTSLWAEHFSGTGNPASNVLFQTIVGPEQLTTTERRSYFPTSLVTSSKPLENCLKKSDIVIYSLELNLPSLRPIELQFGVHISRKREECIRHRPYARRRCSILGAWNGGERIQFLGK